MGTGPFSMGTPLRSIGQKLGPPRSVKLKPTPKLVDPFYDSAEWKGLMSHLKKVRGNRCGDPEHRSEDRRQGVRIYGDHIRERKDGGASLDPHNIMLRCPPCHQRKTAEVRRRRYQGEGASNL